MKSDKPVVVISILNVYDDLIQGYDIPLEQFKSEAQKILGDKYKIAIADTRATQELNLYTRAPLIYPPPFQFFVYEKGERSKSGFVVGYDTTKIFESLKTQLP